MAKQVSPGVLALRKVVDDVHKDAREAKKRGELVGWSSSKFPCRASQQHLLKRYVPGKPGSWYRCKPIMVRYV